LERGREVALAAPASETVGSNNPPLADQRKNVKIVKDFYKNKNTTKMGDL
jgi:hypothetical protein